MTAGKKDISAPGMALRTAAILFVFVILFTGLLSAAYLLDKAGDRSLGRRGKDEAGRRSAAALGI